MINWHVEVMNYRLSRTGRTYSDETMLAAIAGQTSLLIYPEVPDDIITLGDLKYVVGTASNLTLEDGRLYADINMYKEFSTDRIRVVGTGRVFDDNHVEEYKITGLYLADA